jgi:hypothetical protein
MATQAQTDANRRNAKASTGPKTEETKARSARNSQKFGLFATNNCVQPHEQEEYESFCGALWAELAPLGSVEEVTAAEFVRSAWRLRRCAMAEERLGWWAYRIHTAPALEAGREPPSIPPSDPVIYPECLPVQASIDRARTSAQNGMRRAKADLDKLQARRDAKPVQQIEPNPEPVAAPDAKRSQSEPPPQPRQPLSTPATVRADVNQPVPAPVQPPVIKEAVLERAA